MKSGLPVMPVVVQSVLVLEDFAAWIAEMVVSLVMILELF
jgi:hypothetical protein